MVRDSDRRGGEGVEPRWARDDLALMDKIEDWTRVVENDDDRNKVIRQISDMYVIAAEGIMEKGLGSARNPVAVIYARIRQARDMEPMDYFIEEWELWKDSELVQRLRSIDPVDFNDMTTSLAGARDKIAVMISRLRKFGEPDRPPLRRGGDSRDDRPAPRDRDRDNRDNRDRDNRDNRDRDNRDSRDRRDDRGDRDRDNRDRRDDRGGPRWRDEEPRRRQRRDDDEDDWDRDNRDRRGGGRNGGGGGGGPRRERDAPEDRWGRGGRNDREWRDDDDHRGSGGGGGGGRRDRDERVGPRGGGGGGGNREERWEDRPARGGGGGGGGGRDGGRRGGGGGGGRGGDDVSMGSMEKDEVSQFVSQHVEDPDLRTQIMAELSSLTPEGIARVTERELDSAKNKAAVLLKRITQERKGKLVPLKEGGGGGSQAARMSGSSIEKFCSRYALDDNMEDQLRQLPQPAAQVVVSADYADQDYPAEAIQTAINDNRGESEYIPKQKRLLDLLDMFEFDSECARLLRLADSKTLDRIAEGINVETPIHEVLGRMQRYMREVQILRDSTEQIGLRFITGSLRIAEVLPGSPAARAEVKRNWKVVAFNNRPVSSQSQAEEAAGDAMSFRITFVTI